MVRRLVLILIAIVAWNSSAAQSCDLLVAALGSVGADSSNTILIDRTVIGVPEFAFMGWSSLPHGDTAFARRAEPELRKVNATRQAVPSCMVEKRGWTTVSDSVLFSLFTSPNNRWKTFKERYPSARQFALVSQPLVVGDTAVIYVATASGELAGGGAILRFVRDAGGHWIKDAQAELWAS